MQGVLPIYASDVILNDSLYVSFENEPAHDVTGVTKDMFSSVWKDLREKFMTGENLSRISLAHGNIRGEADYQSIGRILEHGFSLVGYVPIFLNPAQLYFLTTGSPPSKEMLLKSFLECLSEYDSSTLKRALEMDIFDQEFKVKLIDLLSSYQIKGLPQPREFGVFLREIAKYELIIKPYFALSHLKRKFWPTGEQRFLQWLERLKPNGEKVSLILKTPEDIDLDPHVDRVFGFLKRFVAGLNQIRSKTFLRFVTGIEVIEPFTKISVQFNGVTDLEKMAPMVHPCGNNLTISKYFFTYEHLEEIFTRVIDHPEFWNSFSLL